MQQIAEHLERFGASRGVRGAEIIGGASMGNQVAQLRQQREVIIATPGRLLDHLEQRTAQLDQVEILVLDEADRMLDMGFMPQLKRIMRYVPERRQTMLFSATMAGEVAEFAKRALHDPARVEIERSGTVARNATQTAFVVNEADKTALLLALLSQDEETTLVFARTQRRADKLAKTLARLGHRVARIHGGRTQAQREHALDGFKSGQHRVLVATDIAARGIDVSDIGHVVMFDISRAPEDHVHRVGRTARAEAVGHASTFVAHEELRALKDIERFLRTSITRADLPDLSTWRAEIERARFAAESQHASHAPRAHSNAPRRGPPREKSRGYGKSHGNPGHSAKPGHGGKKFGSGRRGFAFIGRSSSSPRPSSAPRSNHFDSPERRSDAPVRNDERGHFRNEPRREHFEDRPTGKGANTFSRGPYEGRQDNVDRRGSDSRPSGQNAPRGRFDARKNRPYRSRGERS